MEYGELVELLVGDSKVYVPYTLSITPSDFPV